MALKDVTKLSIEEITECLKTYNETGESQMEGDILGRIAELWNKVEVDYDNSLSIEQLKKQIKYSKNSLEIKMLNKKLNQMYKERKHR